MSKDLFAEEVHPSGFSVKYSATEKLFSGKSEFQKVEIYQTKSHGRMLLNDDLVMTTERDEFVYHEMIAHVPMFVHPNPKNVLIIGGGDGGTAREVLRHPSVESCLMVEIDAMVVEASRKFLPSTSSSFSDPRFEILIEDGLKFVRESERKFDVILVDSTDPIGPAQPLFGEAFYRYVHLRLSENGIVVSQGESVFYEGGMQKKLAEVLGAVFPRVWYYNFCNQTYPGGLWSFSFAAKTLDPLKDFRFARFQELGLEMQYYNSAIHTAAFALPEFMKKNLAKCVRNAE